MFLALNLFSTTCDGDAISTNPGGILLYGGPILYLFAQSLLLFLLLVWVDAGNVGSSVRGLMKRSRSSTSEDDAAVSDEEVAHELERVTSAATAGTDPNNNNAAQPTDGLRVVHVTKSFKKNTAVDNVTFGIKSGEVFALLGPNGAGKSTTISMIRGDLRPNHGDVLVEDTSVLKNLATARTHQNESPQNDTKDQKTVREHLDFYARVRGIPDVNHNVDAVLRAVGLAAFEHRQEHALSGGFF